MGPRGRRRRRAAAASRLQWQGEARECVAGHGVRPLVERAYHANYPHRPTAKGRFGWGCLLGGCPVCVISVICKQNQNRVPTCTFSILEFGFLGTRAHTIAMPHRLRPE